MEKLLKEIERLEEGCDKFEGVIEYMPNPCKSRWVLEGERNVLTHIKAFVEKEYKGKLFNEHGGQADDGE